MFAIIVVSVALQGLVLSSHCSPDIRQTSGGSDFCIVEGVPYRSGEIIPRGHPCHVCVCHLGRAECSWMNCPTAPEGCVEYTEEHYCNPTLYICDIPEYLVGVREKINHPNGSGNPTTTENITHTSGDCNILGVPYKTGDVMGIATSFCLECRCAKQNMYCSPKCCFHHVNYHMTPNEMIAAAKYPTTPLNNPLSHLIAEFGA